MSALNLEHLGAQLKTAREHATLAQNEAAEHLGVTAAALSQYESGKRKIDALALDKLAHLYGVPVTYFFRTEPQPAPVEWEAALREIARELTPRGKAGVSTIVERVRALETLYERTGTPTPGLSHPPFETLPGQVFPDYRVSDLASKVRNHYDLGRAPVHSVKGFLEVNGYLAFTVPLGTDWEQDLSGLFFQHPDLGRVMVINEDQAFTRWPFTLAHEFAHGLFHYDRPAILCRRHDPRPIERFADTFAGYFLVPDEALHEQLEKLGSKTVSRAEDAVKLARYFGVSYRAMVRRLRGENRLGMSDADVNSARPVALAKRLGFRVNPFEFGQRPLPLEERFPRVFLQLAYQAVEEEALSLRRVAEMLGVSHLELEEHLYPEEDLEELEEQAEVASAS